MTTNLFRLAPKEEILQKVAKNDFSYFDEESQQYFLGDRLDIPEYNTPEFTARRKRFYPDDGSEPVLSPEEKAENEVENSVETVGSYNDGDGHQRYMTYYFKPYDLYVTLAGSYFSWGGSSWDEVYVSEPIEHTIVCYERKE
jgi:hypothetical protein